MAGTLALSKAKVSAAEFGDASEHPWYALHPENFESGLTSQIRKALRNLLRLVLIWMIRQYRVLSEKVTIKSAVKRHVRKFLYDHEENGQRHPSEFWNRVRHPKRKTPPHNE